MNEAQEEYRAINHGVATLEEIAMEVAMTAGCDCNWKRIVNGKTVRITRNEVLKRAELIGVEFY